MSTTTTLKSFCMGVALTACMSMPAFAQAKPGLTAQQRTEAHFRTIRSQPPELWSFLKDMPKGGDLHSHLSGAIYAESPPPPA